MKKIVTVIKYIYIFDERMSANITKNIMLYNRIMRPSRRHLDQLGTMAWEKMVPFYQTR